MFGVLFFVCLFNIAQSEHLKEVIFTTLLWLNASKMSLEAGSESGDAAETKGKVERANADIMQDSRWEMIQWWLQAFLQGGGGKPPDSQVTVLILHLKNEVQLTASKL